MTRYWYAVELAPWSDEVLRVWRFFRTWHRADWLVAGQGRPEMRAFAYEATRTVRAAKRAGYWYKPNRRDTGVGECADVPKR